MTPRLATHVEVSALIRRTQALGGFAAVVARGDREAGAILILLRERGNSRGILERSLASDGRYGWQHRTIEDIERKQSVNDYLERRRGVDSDLWVVELDIPEAERFAAELMNTG